MRKIATVIVDDERQSLDHLAQELGSFQRLDIRKQFSNPCLLLSYVDQHPDIQLVVLDKEMKQMDGLDLARQLPPHVLCVMVTGYREFAVDAYKINMVDYILKPALRDRLANTVRRVEERLGLSPSVDPQPQGYGYFWVKTDKKGMLMLVDYDEIAYIKSAGDDCILHYIDGEQMKARARIGILEKELPPDQFIRVHQQYIVNKSYVRRYADSMITLRAGTMEKSLSVGGIYKNQVLSWMKDRLISSKK